MLEQYGIYVSLMEEWGNILDAWLWVYIFFLRYDFFYFYYF